MARNPRKEMTMEYEYNCTEDMAAASVSWGTETHKHLLVVFVRPFTPKDPQWERGYRWCATITHEQWRMVNGVFHKWHIVPGTHEWCFTRDQAADKAVAHIRRLTTAPEGV